MTIIDTPAPDAPAPDAAPPAVETTPAPEPAPTPDAPAAPAADPFDDDKVEQFDRAYVQKLRAEAASHRTKAKTFTEAFDPFDEPSQQVLLDLARTLAADPAAGAAEMKRLAALIEGANQPPEPDPEADKPLTRSDFDRIQKETSEKQAQDAEQARINREVTDLGYTADSEDYVSLLWLAANKHNGDLKAAHDALEAKKQATIDAYLERKRGEAAGTVTAGSGSGAAPANDNPIKDFKDAGAALRERLKSVQFDS